jgi:hypothetical protein
VGWQRGEEGNDKTIYSCEHQLSYLWPSNGNLGAGRQVPAKVNHPPTLDDIYNLIFPEEDHEPLLIIELMEKVRWSQIKPAVWIALERGLS